MRIYLAPMEGVVDHLLRRLYAEIGGVDVAVTEFIRVSQTVLPRKVFSRYCPELVTPLALPVRVQLLGSDPHVLALNAHKAARMGAPAIDLNFGCPAKTVNKSRGGACLLEETGLLYDIVKAVRLAVPPEVPVTAKIRLGYHERARYVENACAIRAAGADELVVHARSKADRYQPPAYWHCIREIRETLDIPVIANGEIWSLADFHRCREESGCTDVMLGRGLLAKPDLARQIKADLAGQPRRCLSWDELLPLVYQYHQQTLRHYAGRYCGNRLKQWLVYLQRQYPEAGVFFEAIKRSRLPADIDAAFDRAGVPTAAFAATGQITAPARCAQ